MCCRLMTTITNRMNMVDKKLEEMNKTLRDIDTKVDALQQHRGYYMYVAMQPAPVVYGALATDLASKQQVSLIEERLAQDRDDWTHESKYPIRFANLSSTVSMESDLRVRGAFSLVWSGLGCGWDTTTRQSDDSCHDAESRIDATKGQYPLNADTLMQLVQSFPRSPSK